MTAGAKVEHVFIHASNHVGRRLNLPHEVNWFGTASHPNTQAVGSRLAESCRWNVVLGDAMVQRRDRMRLHANQRRVIQHADWHSTRAQEYQLVNTKVQRQSGFAIGAA